MNQIYDFLDKNSLYLVMFIVVIIFLGISVYLIRIGKKIKKFEEDE